MEEEVKEKGESGAVEGPGASEVWVLVVFLVRCERVV